MTMDASPSRCALARRGLLTMLALAFVIANIGVDMSLNLSRATASVKQQEDHQDEELKLIQTQMELEALKRQLEGKEMDLNSTKNHFEQKEKQLSDREVALLKEQAAAASVPTTMDDYVAACVMIMDGNHELIEWLAYHYHTLPLRRLILLNDPFSKTTPEPIVQRWQDRMHISIWNDTMVFPDGAPTKGDRGWQYVNRQTVFQGMCLRQLQQEGQRWATLVDPDEYMTINERVYNEQDPMYGLGTVKEVEKMDVPTMKQANATLTFVKRAIAHVHRFGIHSNVYLIPFETPCLGYQRKQYTPYEETDNAHQDSFSLDTVSSQQLSTFRWQYYKPGVVIGKAMLDLSRLNAHDLGAKANVHIPLKNKRICRVRMAWGGDDTMPLVMNHYGAALDQSLFRSGDSRGGAAGRIRRHEKEIGGKRVFEPHGKVKEWLQGFVESVGKEEAERLLQHAGQPYKANAGAYFNASDEVSEEEGMKMQEQLIEEVKAQEVREKEEAANAKAQEAKAKEEEAAEANEEAVATPKTEEAHNNSTCRIPQLIHFVYLSPHLPLEQPPVPERVIKSVEQWAEMNPNWEVKLWNNAMVRENYPDLAQLMHNVTTMAWVADMVRYHVVEQFGGVYLDTDFIPFRPLDGLCQMGNFIVCQDPHKLPQMSPDTGIAFPPGQKCKVAINAIMGFEPHHPGVQKALNESLTSTQWAVKQSSTPRFRQKYTGPWVWTASMKGFSDTVSTLHPYTFLPCHFTKHHTCIEENFRNDTRVFAMHTYEKSW